MLIVPEMDHELEVLEETREEGVLDELKQLRERRDELDYKLQKIIFEEKRQKEKEKMAKTSEEMKMVEQLEKDFETAKLEHRKKTKEYNAKLFEHAVPELTKIMGKAKYDAWHRVIFGCSPPPAEVTAVDNEIDGDFGMEK